MIENEDIRQLAASNDAYNNIIQRTSIRRYTSQPVTDLEIQALLFAAMSAPSGVNRQPWEFIVVRDSATLQRLASFLPYAKMAAHAPAAIIVCGNSERFLEGFDESLWQQDLSAASENILLAANALGLGAVWTCLYPHPDRQAAVAHTLDIPSRLIPFNLIPIGHPDTPHAPINKWNPDRIHYHTGYSAETLHKQIHEH